MFSIADHIASAELVREGSHLYKALRNDGRISAVQVFAYAMNSEQYHAFAQQVNGLAEAISYHRARVPAILSWGSTQTGNFSYIESEWIDGYDLTELPNREKEITVDEIGTIAEQMSRVLLFSHSAGVVHGNISSQHILWDKNREHYCLTGVGFGLQLTEPLSKKIASNLNQQSTLTPAEKDVYDLGLVLFQLLREHLLPNNRIELTPQSQPLFNELLRDGSILPAWLATCLSRALSTDEEKFKSAHEMYNYVILHHKTQVPPDKWYRSKPQQASKIAVKPALKTERTSRQKLQTVWTSGVKKGKQEMRFVFDRHIAIGLLVAGVLAGFSIIAQKREKEKIRESRIAMSTSPHQDTIATADEGSAETVNKTSNKKNAAVLAKDKKKTLAPKKIDKKEKPVEEIPVVNSATDADENNPDIGSYKVKSKAYFHNKPDEATRRNAFIVHWNNATLRPLKEEGDFVYVVFTNHEGQTSKGWLRKKDLIKL